jgi:hypothetical protein
MLTAAKRGSSGSSSARLQLPQVDPSRMTGTVDRGIDERV